MANDDGRVVVLNGDAEQHCERRRCLRAQLHLHLAHHVNGLNERWDSKEVRVASGTF